ncbi:NAD(P)H-hydrate epimerase [Spirosomataceae bacterium TFI 002]|nr:NAD(P)H-hydrate epimerase [Spirosomataceae bacterium TFI 002]
MNIYSAQQQHEIDQNCISIEPISSIDLMERASHAFCKVFKESFTAENKLDVFCGGGNNAGDALAIARILFQQGYDIQVYLIQSEFKTDEFETNLERLRAILPSSKICNWSQIEHPKTNDIAIDGIFGTGLNRPLSLKYGEICQFINSNYTDIVAIDIPSGMYADKLNDPSDAFVKPSLCISFHAPKLCFFLDESGQWIKEWKVVDIGILKEAEKDLATSYHLSSFSECESLITPRAQFTHKGTFGYGMLWAGSIGMFGAAILSSRAAMRSGIGKLTVFSPEAGHDIVQIGTPEAMFLSSKNLHEYRPFSAIGIGPGLGSVANFKGLVLSLLEHYSELPWIIDADAINMFSQNRELLTKLPQSCIFTPHPKELERLTGLKANNRLQQIENARDFCKKHNCILLLKGAYSAICNNEGEVFFNPNGNPGMATAGSGDVLTGIVLAFLSQGYNTQNAAILGAYLHGKAGDKAAKSRNERALIASDIIENL